MAKHYQSYSRIMVEIDLPKCTRTYGVAPCTASVGVTGEDKCFNCIRTCQDRLNYDATTQTLRLADEAPDDYYTVDGVPVPVITNIVAMSLTPAVVRPGIDAGERETITISCREHADSDTQLDPYVTERSYDPYKQGTFWQRLRARYVTFAGFPLRLYRGFAGQDQTEMDVYHYSITGVTSDGKSAKITAKDPFTLADSKNAQAPKLSNGLLVADIDAVATSFTMTPSGVGDEEYPASGKVCLSGKEVCAFTRVGDVMTITRGDNADKHELGSVVQLVLEYVGVSGATIIRDLLVNYSEGIDPDWIDVDAWTAEIDAYYGTLFSAQIAAPFSVAKLVNELIAQLPAVFWWDSKAQQFRLQALRPADPAAPLLDSNSFMETSFKVSEQPDARADSIWTYFGQVDPTKKLDEVNNYATALATVDPNSAVDYNTNAIKTIQSRWIPSVARGTAQVLNATLLSRYRDPPRKVDFSLFRNIVRIPSLGDIYRVTHPYIQDQFGRPAIIPVQLCTVKPDDSSYTCSAQEVVYVPQRGDADSGARFIFIDHNITDVNLRALYDVVFSNLTNVTSVHLVVGSGSAVGGTVPGGYALTILDTDWPSDIDIYIDLTGGMVLGKGGDGLAGAVDPTVGTPLPAGHALKTTRPVFITGTGIVGGGGGAGARWGQQLGFAHHETGGAGGAGYVTGVTGAMSATNFSTFSNSGFPEMNPRPTTELGGYTYVLGFDGSDFFSYGIHGGDLGQDGSGIVTGFGPFGGSPPTCDVGNPGIAGHAIDGYSFVTIVGSDVDVRGATT